MSSSYSCCNSIKKIQVKHDSSPNLVSGFSSPALTSCKFTVILFPSLTMNHSVYKPSRRIVDSIPMIFGPSNKALPSRFCVHLASMSARNYSRKRSKDWVGLPSQNLANRVHVKLNVVTVKGSFARTSLDFSELRNVKQNTPRNPRPPLSRCCCGNAMAMRVKSFWNRLFLILSDILTTSIARISRQDLWGNSSTYKTLKLTYKTLTCPNSFSHHKNYSSMMSL